MNNLHQYPRGHGFKSCTGLNLFRALFSLLLRQCSLLQRLLSCSHFYLQFTYMTFIYSQLFIMNKQILNNTLSIGIILVNIVTSSSNFLSDEDLLYFSSVQFSLVMTMVMLITFPAMSVKWDNGYKIYLSLHMYNPIMS